MTIDYRDRFGLKYHPFHKNTHSKQHYKTPWFKVMEERFLWSLSEGGIWVMTGEPGTGKTASIHALTCQLSDHQHKVVYLEDAQTSANDMFRSMACLLGLEPQFRRSALLNNIKDHLLKLHQENNQKVIIIIDDAHRLVRESLHALSSFTNFKMDSREILTIWLIGERKLLHTLALTVNHHLRSRVRYCIRLDPFSRQELKDYIQNCLDLAGCKRQVCSKQVMDAVYLISKGLPRSACHLMSIALRIAHEKDLDIIDETVLETARSEVML